MNLRDIPIRRKLGILFLLTTAAAMVTMRSTFLVFEFKTFRDANRQQLQMLGRVVAKNSTAALAFDDPGGARDILSSLAVDEHITAAALFRPDGSVFARYPGDLADDQLPKELGDGYAFGRGRLVGYEPVTENGRRLGTLYLRLDTAAMSRDWLVQAGLLAVVVMLLVISFAALVARALMKHISEPILSLANTTHAVTDSGDYSLRAPRLGRDELGQLAEDFNAMLARVETQNQEIRELNSELEERVKRRTAQLEAANHELEAFSYSVSHDLRAPLRHIDGFVQLLQDRTAARLDETDRRYLGIVAKSAQNMGVLIDELLEFSRMGRTAMHRVTVETAALVDSVIAEYAAASPERQIEWKATALPAVHADPAMLRQVWRNLIGNAVKYTGKRPVARIEIGHRETADGDVFLVRDNGAGFDMKYVEKLFGVFQRLHANNEFEGTGIGLANVRRIVQRHGGRVWAEGVVDGGATFFFLLPRDTPESMRADLP